METQKRTGSQPTSLKTHVRFREVSKEKRETRKAIYWCIVDLQSRPKSAHVKNNYEVRFRHFRDLTRTVGFRNGLRQTCKNAVLRGTYVNEVGRPSWWMLDAQIQLNWTGKKVSELQKFGGARGVEQAGEWVPSACHADEMPLRIGTRNKKKHT